MDALESTSVGGSPSREPTGNPEGVTGPALAKAAWGNPPWGTRQLAKSRHLDLRARSSGGHQLAGADMERPTYRMKFPAIREVTGEGARIARGGRRGLPTSRGGLTFLLGAWLGLGLPVAASAQKIEPLRLLVIP